MCDHGCGAGQAGSRIYRGQHDPTLVRHPGSPSFGLPRIVCRRPLTSRNQLGISTGHSHANRRAQVDSSLAYRHLPNGCQPVGSCRRALFHSSADSCKLRDSHLCYHTQPTARVDKGGERLRAGMRAKDLATRKDPPPRMGAASLIRKTRLAFHACVLTCLRWKLLSMDRAASHAAT